MKIHGPNHTNFNPYKNQAQKLDKVKKEHQQEDRLEISSHAKQLQQSKKTSVEREKYVQDIKQAIDTGEYKINYEKTAKKDRKSTRLNSSHVSISYAVFCLKK